MTIDDVERVCHGHEGRLMFIGPNAAGRALAVILAPGENDAYYPITARPADRKERRIYAEETADNPPNG